MRPHLALWSALLLRASEAHCAFTASFKSKAYLTKADIFNRLILDGVPSKEFQYIRDVESTINTWNDTWLKSFPIYGTTDPSLRCGRSSFPVHNADTIETAVIKAGDQVGFMLSGPYFKGDTEPAIFHPGPGHIFLSKLPAELKDLNVYDGSGDFFKIAYAGPESAKVWSLDDKNSMNATIPKTTPPGKYLMRIEHLFATNQLHMSQWFVTCAHVEIVGPGGGTPGPTTRFPNAYKEDDPSVWFHVNGTQDGWVQDVTTYVQLKPDVWTG